MLLLSVPQTNTKYVKLIERNANRVQKLISNILDMAKIDNLNLKLYKESFSLPDLISTYVYDFRNQIRVKRKNLDLIFDNRAGSYEEDKDVIIEADKERIT